MNKYSVTAALKKSKSMWHHKKANSSAGEVEV